MENVKLDPRWEKLFHSNFPETTITDTPNVLPVVSDVAESFATSPAPVSTSGGSNGNLGNTILILGLLGLACYGGYRWYNYIQKKKNKRV